MYVRYVSLYPYNEDSVLLGYAGMLCYLLLEIEKSQERHHETINSSFSSLHSFADSFYSTHDNFTQSIHYRNAVIHFEASLNAPYGYSHDMFILYFTEVFISCLLYVLNRTYNQLLTAAGDIQSAENILVKFQTKYPQNPNAHR